MSAPEIPPMRQYLVARQKEDGTYIDHRTFDAHEHDIFPAGITLRTFHIHPEYGPTVTTRTFLRPSSGWLEVEEVLPSVSLITAPDAPLRLLN